jgi:hypothetical protein
MNDSNFLKSENLGVEKFELFIHASFKVFFLF